MTELSPEGLLQLAQYQPHKDGGASREETFRQMVAPVLMESGGSVGSADVLRESFQTLFRVEVDSDELDGWLDHLEDKGAIERDGGTISVTDAARGLLEKSCENFKELSGAAKKEWRASLLRVEPALSEEDLDNFEADLDKLIAHIVAYHGAEAAVILYPEEERSEALRETLRRKAESLPRRGDPLDEIRRQGFAQFFHEPTANQRRYLADRLDHGFFSTVGTLRPEAAAAIKEQLAGQRMYLDTNVLIGAFGLAGRSVNQSMKRLLDLTCGLGVELAVTSRTVEEFRHSLDSAKAQIESRGLPSRRYAGVLVNAAREIGGISLLEGFYENYGAHGSTPDDWFRRAAQFEPVFAELGIQIRDEGLDAVLKNDGARVNDYVVLINREALYRSRRPRARDDAPLLHDAIHRALIERLRGKGTRRFGTAQFWFLTEDKVLSRFGHLALEGEAPPTIPFCISGAAWGQIARCFTPRTDDFDQTITDLLASPYLRFGKRRNLGELQQAVARISTMLGDGGSPKVVAAAVSDETLEAASGVSEPEEKDRVLLEAYRSSEDALGRKMEQLQVRVESVEEKLDEERGKQEASKSEAASASAENEELAKTIAKQQQELKEAEEALARERSASASEIERIRADRERDDKKRKEVVDRRIRIGLIIAAIFCLLAAIALPLTGVVSVSAALIGGGIVIPLLLARLIEKSRWAWTILFVLAVIALAVGLIPLVTKE